MKKQNLIKIIVKRIKKAILIQNQQDGVLDFKKLKREVNIQKVKRIRQTEDFKIQKIRHLRKKINQNIRKSQEAFRIFNHTAQIKKLTNNQKKAINLNKSK